MNSSATFGRHLFICIILIVIDLKVSGQEWIISDDMNRFIHHLRTEKIDVNIAGTPYLYDEFIAGTIVTTDSLLYNNIPLRFNIYNDEMEFRLNPGNEIRIIGNPRNFLVFSINENVFNYLTFIENNRSQQGYFEVLNQGNCLVLVRRKVVLADREEVKAYSDAKPARFEKMPDQYFLKFGNKLPGEVRLRRRSIVDAFDDKRQEINDFIKQERLPFRNVDNLVKVADYYNRLVEGSD